MSMSASAAKEGLTTAMSACIAAAVSPVRRKMSNWKAESKIEKLYQHIREVRKVKTIWSMDKSVDLAKFYYPTSVILHDELNEDFFPATKVVKYISNLGDENYIVEGTVGQGKSIFFRYLTSQEMYCARRVPIFLELRRLGREKLRARIADKLSELEISDQLDVQEHI